MRCISGQDNQLDTMNPKKFSFINFYRLTNYYNNSRLESY